MHDGFLIFVKFRNFAESKENDSDNLFTHFVDEENLDLNFIPY